MRVQRPASLGPLCPAAGRTRRAEVAPALEHTTRRHESAGRCRVSTAVSRRRARHRLSGRKQLRVTRWRVVAWRRGDAANAASRSAPAEGVRGAELRTRRGRCTRRSTREHRRRRDRRAAQHRAPRSGARAHAGPVELQGPVSQRAVSGSQPTPGRARSAFRAEAAGPPRHRAAHHRAENVAGPARVRARRDRLRSRGDREEAAGLQRSTS